MKFSQWIKRHGIGNVIGYQFPVGSMGFPSLGERKIEVPDDWDRVEVRTQAGLVFHRWLRRYYLSQLGYPDPTAMDTFQDYQAGYLLGEQPSESSWRLCLELIRQPRLPRFEVGMLPDGCFFEFGNFKASPDLVLDSTLVEVKVSASMKVTQRMVNQLIAYLCVMRENDIFIDRIGIYSAFHRRLVTRPVLKKWEKGLERLTDWLAEEAFK